MYQYQCVARSAPRLDPRVRVDPLPPPASRHRRPGEDGVRPGDSGSAAIRLKASGGRTLAGSRSSSPLNERRELLYSYRLAKKARAVASRWKTTLPRMKGLRASGLVVHSSAGRKRAQAVALARSAGDRQGGVGWG